MIGHYNLDPFYISLTILMMFSYFFFFCHNDDMIIEYYYSADSMYAFYCVYLSLHRELRSLAWHFLSLFVRFCACVCICCYETTTLYHYYLPALARSTFTSCARCFFSSSSIFLCWRMLVVLYSALSLPRQSSPLLLNIHAHT